MTLPCFTNTKMCKFCILCIILQLCYPPDKKWRQKLSTRNCGARNLALYTLHPNILKGNQPLWISKSLRLRSIKQGEKFLRESLKGSLPQCFTHKRSKTAEKSCSRAINFLVARKLYKHLTITLLCIHFVERPLINAFCVPEASSFFVPGAPLHSKRDEGRIRAEKRNTSGNKMLLAARSHSALSIDEKYTSMSFFERHSSLLIIRWLFYVYTYQRVWDEPKQEEVKTVCAGG